MHDHIQEILFSSDEIAQRVSALGKQITEDYSERIAAGEELVVLCVLKGAAIFMADLVRQIELPLAMDYMAISSYGAGTKSSGVVRIQKDLSNTIEGKHVIVAEDIIDSGLTLGYLLKNLASRNPASLAVAALLHKHTPDQEPIECRYVGFDCPDAFIVGYGLDFAERYRNLPYIGILRPEIYK